MNLFTRLPLSAPTGSLPVISPSDIDYFVDYEAQSYDHWVFGSDASSLVGLNNGNALSPQSTPTYGSNYARIGTAVGNGLRTALEDSATSEDTVVAVVRVATLPGIQIPFGTLDTSTGGSLFFGDGNCSITYRGIFSSQPAGNAITANTWHFVAVSRDFRGTGKSIKSLVGGGSVVERASSATYSPAPAGRKISAGNAYYGSGVATGVMDLAEFIVFNRALSSAELLALYARRKTKLAARGVTVV